MVTNVSNPAVFDFPPHTNIIINAMSNADNTQLLHVTEPSGSINITFKGQGEGVAMKTADGRDVVLIGPVSKTRTLAFRFQYQSGGSQQVSTSQLGCMDVNTCGKFKTISIGSEDQRDLDFNDTRAFIICESGLN